MSSHIPVACAIAAIAVAATVTGAQAGLLAMFGPAARAAANSNPTGKKNYGANTLTPGQLKLCILDAYKVDNMNLEIESDVAPLDKDRAEVKRTEQLARGKPETDKGVIDYHAKVKAFNERIESIKAKVAAEKTLHDRFHANCDGKGFFQSDIKAVLAELGPTYVNAVMRQK
jgi:hypothetical protein